MALWPRVAPEQWRLFETLRKQSPFADTVS